MAGEGNVANKIKDRRDKIQKAQELQDRRKKETTERTQQTKSDYMSAKDSPVLKDILAKAKTFQAYHHKIAQDGVGSRATGDRYENGTPVMDVYFLNPAERVTHLDKEAGIQELIDYIERQLSEEVPKPEAPVEAEEDDTKTEEVDNPSEA